MLCKLQFFFSKTCGLEAVKLLPVGAEDIGSEVPTERARLLIALGVRACLSDCKLYLILYEEEAE